MYSIFNPELSFAFMDIEGICILVNTQPKLKILDLSILINKIDYSPFLG